MRTSNIFLVGLPGAGKSTYGRQLAEALAIPFFDLDEEIVNKEGRAITEVFTTEGEAYFRSVEQHCLHQFVASKDRFILATGGGTPCFFDNMEIMKQEGLTVFINTPIEIIKRRLGEDHTRPLMKKISIEELFKKREACYRKASITVSDYEELLTALSRSN